MPLDLYDQEPYREQSWEVKQHWEHEVQGEQDSQSRKVSTH